MPKVPVKESTAVVTLIQENLARLNWLLRGNIDTANIQEDTASNSFKIPTKKIRDFADDTRPVTGMKFFANTSASTEVTMSIWDKLHDLLDNSVDYIVLTGRANWAFNIANLPRERRAPLDIEPHYHGQVYYSSELNALSKRIIIRKTPFIAPIKDSDDKIVYNISKFNCAKDLSLGSDYLFFKLGDPVNNYDEIVFDADLEMIGLVNDEFLVCDLEIQVLCEVLK